MFSTRSPPERALAGGGVVGAVIGAGTAGGASGGGSGNGAEGTAGGGSAAPSRAGAATGGAAISTVAGLAGSAGEPLRTRARPIDIQTTATPANTAEQTSAPRTTGRLARGSIGAGAESACAA